MPDPTLSEVHADLVGRLEQDKRLRMLEQAHAASSATLQALLTEVAADRSEQRERERQAEQRQTENSRQMEERLTAAIQDTKPKNIWAASGVLVAAAAVVVAIVTVFVH